MNVFQIKEFTFLTQKIDEKTFPETISPYESP